MDLNQWLRSKNIIFRESTSAPAAVINTIIGLLIDACITHIQYNTAEPYICKE